MPTTWCSRTQLGCCSSELTLHDLAGRVTRITYPDATEARYAYDPAGRLSRVTDAAGAPYAAYTYAPDGSLSTHIVGNNVVTGTHSYTLRDWLQKVDLSPIPLPAPFPIRIPTLPLPYSL